MSWIHLLFLIVSLFIIALLCYNSTSTFKNPIIDIITDSENKTRFSPTYFEIYDKSTETQCTRLIIIYPFRWYIYSQNNEVFLINSESGFSCPTNMTPGVEIKKSTDLQVVCLSMDFNLIFSFFQDIEPIRIEYSLLGVEKFTITDALNMLFDGYLTLTDEQSSRLFRVGTLKYLSTKIYGRVRNLRELFEARESTPVLEQKKIRDIVMKKLN